MHPHILATCPITFFLFFFAQSAFGFHVNLIKIERFLEAQQIRMGERKMGVKSKHVKKSKMSGK